MAIEFACPKGHRIRCADDKAGRPGKCPKCGEKFVIPQPGASSPTQLAQGGSAPPPIEEGSGVGGNTIVFLCPNGHKLNGPRSLQGRPGECPHCGSKFRIPNYDEDEEDWGEDQHEDTVVDDEIPVGTIVEDGAPLGDSVPIDLEEIEPIEVGQFPDEEAFGTPDGFSTGPESHDGGPHPLSRLFDRLWQEKADGDNDGDNDGGIVEVHLADGAALTPEWYSSQMSSGSHAVFAGKDADGSFTITSIAWDSVAKITVRQVKQLPEDMF
jgi:hypothetical protein